MNFKLRDESNGPDPHHKKHGSQCFGFSSKNILRNTYLILTHTLKDKQQCRKEITQLFIRIV